MPILELTPHTCTDSFYAMGREQPTSMRSLSNLVPSPDSPDQWVPRPAAILYPGSNVFTPGFVSAQIVIGNRLYGMVSSALNAGKDQPFCYDLIAQAVVSISGITNGNTPTSPATTGAWTTPHMELIGVKIIVTHPGFSGSGANFFGVIDTGNPGALAWTAANTATNLLPSVPVWVNQFGGRAYYFCNPVNGQPAVLASDVLDPLTMTNGTFVLTFGDNIPLLCGGTLAFNNQLGGIIQALVVFKGATNVFQVTGDFALLTTAINSLNVATGTLSPNSVTPTPKGLIFIAPDGLRLIDFTGNISDPIGVAGSGVAVPFLAAVNPSRICAASNASTIRLSTQNGATQNNDQQEWCFDFTRGAWHGPHTFPVSLISEYGNSFVVSPVGIKGIWSSDIIPNTSSTYVENGGNYTCDYRSGNMPERAGVNELSTVKAVLYLGSGAGVSTFTIIARDDAGNPINTVGVSFTTTIVTWDHFTWGSGVSLGASQQLSALDIPWTFPIVFDRMSIEVQVVAAVGVRIGKYLMDYQILGYTVKGPVLGMEVFSTPDPVPLPPPPIPPPPPPVIDPGLAPLLACMPTQPTAARQVIINATLIALRAAGLLGKLDVLYVCATEVADQSLCNWVDPTKFHATNNSAVFTANRGWLGGAGTYIQPNWTPSTDAVNYTLNNASVFAWTPTDVDSGSALMSADTTYMSPGYTLNQTRLNTAVNSADVVSIISTNGLHTMVRTSLGGYKVYLNNNNYLNVTKTSTNVPTTNTFFATAIDRTASIFGAGAALTPADISNMYNIFVTYFTAIGSPY